MGELKDKLRKVKHAVEGVILPGKKLLGDKNAEFIKDWCNVFVTGIKECVLEFNNFAMLDYSIYHSASNKYSPTEDIVVLLSSLEKISEKVDGKMTVEDLKSKFMPLFGNSKALFKVENWADLGSGVEIRDKSTEAIKAFKDSVIDFFDSFYETLRRGKNLNVNSFKNLKKSKKKEFENLNSTYGLMMDDTNGKPLCNFSQLWECPSKRITQEFVSEHAGNAAKEINDLTEAFEDKAKKVLHELNNVKLPGDEVTEIFKGFDALK